MLEIYRVMQTGLIVKMRFITWYSDLKLNYSDHVCLQKFFQSGRDGGRSDLVVEWTNQHGCGGDEDDDPHKLNCNMVLQYMCQPGDETMNGELMIMSPQY